MPSIQLRVKFRVQTIQSQSSLLPIWVQQFQIVPAAQCTHFVQNASEYELLISRTRLPAQHVGQHVN